MLYFFKKKRKVLITWQKQSVILSTGNVHNKVCNAGGISSCYLTFIGPSIVIYEYSYSTTNKKHLLFQIIYSACFGRSFRPSSGIQNCVYSNGICQTAAAIGDEMELRFISSPIAAGSSSCLTYTVAVYAVLNSWWWTKRPPKHVERFTRINNFG
jgi:hypothetical protein